MKRKTYLERAARALGATPLVMPPRVLWSPARRAAVEDEDATTVATTPTPTRSSVEDRRPRLSTVAAKTETGTDRRERLSSTESVNEAVVTSSGSEGPGGEGGAQLPPTRPLASARGDKQPAMTAPSKPTSPRSSRAIHTAPPQGDAAAIEPLAPAPSARSARREEQQQQHATNPPPPPLLRQQSRASQTQASPARVVRSAEAANEDVSVRIGAIDVIVEPPPRPARPPAPLQPLARGFTSPFGLRQG